MNTKNTIRAALIAASTLIMGSGLVLAQQPAPQNQPAPTQQQQMPAAANTHISWTELVQKLEGQGYTIRELDQRYDGWKAEVIDSNHYKLDLRIDRQGNIIHSKYDD